MWKIRRDGKQLVITSDGKKTVRTFTSDEQAIAQHDKLVKQHEQELASRRSILLVDPRHPELEQAIVNAPEDPAAYAVYADWLQTQGDPRGALMALHLASPYRSREHSRATSREIAAHPGYFYGPLAVHRAHEVFRWHFGFIHGADLGNLRMGEPAKVLEELLAHPSGRFLVSLTVAPRDVDPAGAQPIVDTLVRLAPATLRSIHFYAQPGLDLSQLWAALPRLRSLALVRTRCRIGVLAVPELESLRIVGDAIAADEIATITRAAWPMLTSLELVDPHPRWLGDLVEMLQRSPRIDHLQVSGTDIARLVGGLPDTLVTLDLSDTAMTDAQAIELARHPLPRLARISASRNRLSTVGTTAIRSMAKDAWV